jgi:hypothetical protein
MSINVAGKPHDPVDKMMSRRARARDLYLLQAAADYKVAMKRRDGSQGAASPVRHIFNRGRDGEVP